MDKIQKALKAWDSLRYPEYQDLVIKVNSILDKYKLPEQKAEACKELATSMSLSETTAFKYFIESIRGE